MRWGAAIGLVIAVGCQSGPRLAGLNPFYRPELTTFERPAERIERIRAVAAQSTGADTPEQQAIVRDLIEPLAVESDPLIRQATMETLAEFRTPLAAQALLVGLSDEDAHVRHTCCRLVGDRADRPAIETLQMIAAEDDSFDVRVAA
ncbi:MAG: HEAT repeat domain-containing protein, partial [Planctomycetota bacterium]